MYSALVAVCLAVLVGWLLRRYRSEPGAQPPSNDMWQAFDRGEDPTGDQ